jgi:hypothetical protein
MKGTGRPTVYDQELHDLWVWSLALEGLTDKEIAQRMGIAKSTLNKWKLEHPSFSDSIKQGKAGPDAKVVKSLYQRAIGYDYEEREVILDTVSGRPTRIKQTKKHVPPDVTAGIFWTKNRMSDQWRDNKKFEQERIDIEHKRLALEYEKLEIYKQKAGLGPVPDDAPILMDSLGAPDDGV